MMGIRKTDREGNEADGPGERVDEAEAVRRIRKTTVAERDGNGDAVPVLSED
jgi:hypothetical protein